MFHLSTACKVNANGFFALHSQLSNPRGKITNQTRVHVENKIGSLRGCFHAWWLIFRTQSTFFLSWRNALHTKTNSRSFIVGAKLNLASFVLRRKIPTVNSSHVPSALRRHFLLLMNFRWNNFFYLSFSFVLRRMCVESDNMR